MQKKEKPGMGWKGGEGVSWVRAKKHRKEQRQQSSGRFSQHLIQPNSHSRLGRGDGRVDGIFFGVIYVYIDKYQSISMHPLHPLGVSLALSYPHTAIIVLFSSINTSHFLCVVIFCDPSCFFAISYCNNMYRYFRPLSFFLSTLYQPHAGSVLLFCLLSTACV